jgi:Tol biopolymer transport system component
MTTEARFERQLPAILEDLYLGPSPDYRDEVLAAATRTRQRPAWTFPGRWIPMDISTRTIPVVRLPLRQLAVLALLVALLAAALAVYIGSQRHVPAPFGPAKNGLIPYVSNGDIYVGDPVTGTTKLLVTNPRGTNPSAPGFSPDGTRLAFFRDVPSASGVVQLPVDIYVVRDDGTGLTRINASPFKDVVWVSWTPDGRSLAVIHPVDGINQLDLLDADGKRAPQRIDAAAKADLIAYRPPDGKQIIFRALVGLKYGLFVMNADGTGKRTLVQPTNPVDIDQDLNAATYSADGTRIFYQRWFPDSIQLWVMNADGTDQHEFYPEPGQGWDGIANPSPDGKWVAYWHVIEDGRATQRVSVVRADGTGPIIATGPDLVGTANFIWSPDSTKILMLPNNGSSPSGFLLDPAGGQWTTLPWRSDTDIDWQRLAP